MFWKKVSLKISKNPQENTCVGASNKVIKKETPTQMFSHEFCEMNKNTSFIEHISEIASISAMYCKL